VVGAPSKVWDGKTESLSHASWRSITHAGRSKGVPRSSANCRKYPENVVRHCEDVEGYDMISWHEILNNIPWALNACRRCLTTSFYWSESQPTEWMPPKTVDCVVCWQATMSWTAAYHFTLQDERSRFMLSACNVGRWLRAVWWVP